MLSIHALISLLIRIMCQFVKKLQIFCCQSGTLLQSGPINLLQQRQFNSVTMYAADLIALIQRHGFCPHLYADDTQIWLMSTAGHS